MEIKRYLNPMVSTLAPMTLPLLVVLFLVVGWSCRINAASIPEQISFQNVLENKDIDIGEGSAFYQDSEGFMWLGGGNALYRYDGYEFKQIFIEPSDGSAEKAPVNFTMALFEDSQHTLWVGSKGGMLIYNSSKGTLTRSADDDSQPLRLSIAHIYKIRGLPSGEIIACAAAGLFIIDPHTHKYTAIVPDKNKPSWLQSQIVRSAYVDKKNSDIWLGTDAGLEKFDWQTKRFTFYSVSPENPDLPLDNRVTDIVSDQEGKFWLGTEHGLVYYDPITRQSKRYLNDPNDRSSISGNDIWVLLFDTHGVLWAGSDGGGISVYDKTNNKFINHQSDVGRVGAIHTNKVRTLFEDNAGDIWAGNYPVGVNFFDRSSAPIVSYAQDASNPKSISADLVLSAQEDKNGNLWLGTDGGGLNFFDRATNEFTHFKTNVNDPTTINGNAVLSIYIDSAGLIWTGTWGGGFASYNPVDKKFTRYPFDAERKITTRMSTSARLNSGPVWDIKEDKNHDLWLATYTGGISKFDRKTKLFTHYNHIDGDPKSLSGNMGWSTLRDASGELWVGTTAGLSKMNPDGETFTNYLPDATNPKALSDNLVLSLHEDRKQRLWVGTSHGLNLFNRETQEFTVFNKKDGFLNEYIKTVLEDADGVIWVSTNNGFSSFNPDTKKIKNFNRIGGRLTGGFAMHSGVTTRRGEIVFGGSEGFRIINPKDISENNAIPTIALIDLKIFSTSVVPGGDDGVLTQVINNTETIVLDYKKSMFEFEFAALNFRDTEKNNYTYKLEGFDKDWMNASNQRTAKYTNLNAGTYVFKVKGSNNDGLWNEAGKSITIIQLPPPWKTWWAYTLYGLAVFSLLVWFVYSQRRKRKLIEAQNKLLEIKVAERTAEVIEKSKDIQAMLSHMPQGLFVVRADGHIHPEYSAYLESIFETNDIADKNVNDFLFVGTNIESDALDSSKAAIFAIIGEDEMNFEFNESLLPGEFSIQIHDKQKHLALNWNPIIEDERVSKLMVSVRDVTQFKKMEAASQEQKRQLDIISQLLNVSADKFFSFESSALNYIQENRNVISNTIDAKQYQESLALLFRNMHTIKGNCRTYGFSGLSNRVHDVESTYSSLKDNALKNSVLESVSASAEEASLKETGWNEASLLADLNRVEQDLAEYSHVYRDVLGRGKGKGSVARCDGFWINNSVMDGIQAYIKNEELDNYKEYISRINALSIENNVADVVASLPSIAAQLDKQPPKVHVSSSNVFIKLHAQTLMSDIFAHMLRNCIDHGIETTEARIAANKNEQGSIFIRTQVHHDKLNIFVSDDGRGLNIPTLFNKGVELGQWRAGSKPNLLTIAQLVFVSGVSTKEQVTDISGRGVGMDAVKQLLQKKGGDIAINLPDESFNGQCFVAFELNITLPAELFFEVEKK